MTFRILCLYFEAVFEAGDHLQELLNFIITLNLINPREIVSIQY